MRTHMAVWVPQGNTRTCRRVFWSSWAGVMHDRLPCVGHADAGMLRTGDPAGLGRLRRDRWPGVRPRSVSYSGGRAATGGG